MSEWKYENLLCRKEERYKKNLNRVGESTKIYRPKGLILSQKIVLPLCEMILAKFQSLSRWEGVVKILGRVRGYNKLLARLEVEDVSSDAFFI